MEELLPVAWEDDKLVLLDQTRLPNDIVFEGIDNIEGVWHVIKRKCEAHRQ